jgi:NAD(P)-dependent dehydrogenase (short-subunit alcohol dehydrogenase family)
VNKKGRSTANNIPDRKNLIMKTQKVWLVTGASKGFGFEITKAILESGDKVVATVRKDAEKLEKSLNNDDNLLVVIMDVTIPEQVEKAVGEAITKFGRLDVIVNNAGFGVIGAIEEISDQEARQQYDTNFFGVLNVIRATLPQLRKQRSGHIINFTSLFGYNAIPTWGLYGSTKFALEGISAGLALEVSPFGIKVTALAPGLFRTQFLNAGAFVVAEKHISDYDSTMVGQLKNGAEGLHGNQPGDPVKLAKVVVELAAVEDPPLHLPVGLDSLDAFRSAYSNESKEIEEWAGKFTPTEI